MVFALPTRTIVAAVGIGILLICGLRFLLVDQSFSSNYQNNVITAITKESTVQDTIMSAEGIFLQYAQSGTPITDKVTDHDYQIMYGQFLIPFYERKPQMKMLEIGLGCDMKYGPGASVTLWKKLFPLADLWEAEFDGACVERSKQQGQLDGLNVLVGDQMDIGTLDKWIDQTGRANFDVVIDDGGHQQCQIWTTFRKLWPLLLPGGLYFIEDLQVSRSKNYFGIKSSPLCEKNTNVPDELKQMIDNMIHRNGTDVKFIFCQRDACVLGKKD